MIHFTVLSILPTYIRLIGPIQPSEQNVSLMWEWGKSKHLNKATGSTQTIP